MEFQSEKGAEDQAISNITMYLNRGGANQGDVPEILGGFQLCNTIGFAMGFMPEMPTEAQMEAAEKGEFCYYSGDALKAIRHIVDQLVRYCGGDARNYITILPVNVYFGGKLHELPLFRCSRYLNSPSGFVDHTGRTYSSFQDWLDNNKLPAAVVFYPKGGILQSDPSNTSRACLYHNTPANRTSATVVKGADITAGVVGIGAAVATLFTGDIKL